MIQKIQRNAGLLRFFKTFRAYGLNSRVLNPTANISVLARAEFPRPATVVFLAAARLNAILPDLPHNDYRTTRGRIPLKTA